MPSRNDFEICCVRCDFQLIHEADRAAELHEAENPSHFSELLIAGFDGRIGRFGRLLSAGVHAAERATIVLADPRDEARDLDETWISTWEENFGPAKPIGINLTSNETLFPELFETKASDRDARVELSAKTHFLVGYDLNEQARAIVEIVRNFLGSESGERIGILFPAAGALHRLVASLLSEAKIPHHDTIAHLAPGPLDDEAWHAWLELQENPRLRIFCRFLYALPHVASLFDKLGAEQIEDILRSAYRDLLIDDLDLLREYCRRNDRPDAQKVAAGLNAIRVLPERATLPEYLAATREIFLLFEWTERWRAIEQVSLPWSQQIATAFARSSYLRWLAQVSASLYPVRDPTGNHPYSRVQLLVYGQAEGQDWSHIVFTGFACSSRPGAGNLVAVVGVAGVLLAVPVLTPYAAQVEQVGVPALAGTVAVFLYGFLGSNCSWRSRWWASCRRPWETPSARAPGTR